MAQTSSIENPDKDIVLHYIDKLYSTQAKIWESMNRIVLTEVILSIILISLSSGIISLDENVEVTGLKIKISLSVVLSLGSLIIATLFTQFASQLKHSFTFREKIEELYSSLGYSVPLLDTKSEAFQPPGFFGSIVATIRDDSSNKFISGFSILFTIIMLGGVMIIMPVAAQIACGLKVAALFDHRWWIYLLFGVLVIFTILFIFITTYEERSNVESGVGIRNHL
jgi:hypothetical protein